MLSQPDENQGVNFDSDDFVSAFERTIRKLFPGMDAESNLAHPETTSIAKRSELQKKQSSRWNEDDGFVAEPHRSTKKKSSYGDLVEGTSSKPLLLSDWSNVQLLEYCNACGVDFVNSDKHADECISYLRMRESERVTPFKGSA